MKLRTILLVLALLAFLSASIGGYLYYASLKRSAVREAERVAATQANVIKERLSSYFSENLQIIRALARTGELRHALMDADEASLRKANSLLDNLDYFDDALGYDASYLLDQSGRTVASSNPDGPDTFMLKNHVLDSYFQTAIQGSPALYTSKSAKQPRPDVYLSHPVYGKKKDTPIGVVVIKATVEPIENKLRRFNQGIVLLTDSHGAIFASNRKEWLSQALLETSPDDASRSVEGQNAARGLSNSVNLKLRGEKYAVDRSGRKYLIYQMNIDNYPGWNLVYLASLKEISENLLSPLIGTSGYAILILCCLIGISVLFLYRAASYDIVQRKLAQDALRESEERYRAIVEDMPAMICRFLPEGTLTFVNAPYCLYFGKQREELLGKNFFQFLPERVQKKVREHFTSLTEERPMITLEHQVAASDGSVRWQQWTDRALFDEQSVLVEYQSIGLDITERKVAREEKAKLEKQLQQAQKMEAVGTLAGGIAHDFNNLLQLLQSHAELLLLNRSFEESAEEKVQDIIRAVGRGGKLTRQLLTFSRKIESKLRSTDLNHEVKEVKELLSRTIPKMVQIEIHLADDLRPINGDSVQLEQILMNLALNAKDAMPDGGKLIISTENVTIQEEDQYIHADLMAGEYVLLRVSDTGHGMDNETVERMFEPFFSTKSPGQGSGLGLAMVYGIIQSHNGHISCESKPGEGTAFKIYLPAIKSGSEQVGEEMPQEPVGGSETILLVDDEESILKSGEEMLSRFGYNTLSAASGEMALELYRRRHEDIDLVILDLVMPGMAGNRCLEELLEINPEAQVIVASGHSPEGPAKGTIDARAKGFISKPYNATKMLNVVRRVIDSG
jgi:PAS domain S-box-containing protein